MTDSPAAAPPDLPEFEPVPTVARHDGWSPDRQRRFIAALALLGSVAAACRAVGISSAAAYKLRGRADAAGFGEAWNIALAMGRDRVWERAVDRAVNGYTRPMHARGKVVGYRHSFDSRLAYAIAYGERLADPYAAFDQAVSRIASSTSEDGG